jgi:hypothetical protein
MVVIALAVLVALTASPAAFQRASNRVVDLVPVPS